MAPSSGSWKSSRRLDASLSIHDRPRLQLASDMVALSPYRSTVTSEARASDVHGVADSRGAFLGGGLADRPSLVSPWSRPAGGVPGRPLILRPWSRPAGDSASPTVGRPCLPGCTVRGRPGGLALLVVQTAPARSQRLHGSPSFCCCSVCGQRSFCPRHLSQADRLPAW